MEREREPQLRTKLENGLQLKCLGLVRKARYDEQENGWGANQTRMGVFGDDRLATGIGGSSAVGKSGAARRGCRLWGDRGVRTSKVPANDARKRVYKLLELRTRFLRTCYVFALQNRNVGRDERKWSTEQSRVLYFMHAPMHHPSNE